MPLTLPASTLRTRQRPAHHEPVRCPRRRGAARRSWRLPTLRSPAPSGKTEARAVVVSGDEPVREETRQGPRRLLGIGRHGPAPARGLARTSGLSQEISARNSDVRARQAQARHDQAPGLAVGAVPGLAATSSGVLVRRLALRDPPALRRPRALLAARVTSRAHERAQLHHRHGPLGRVHRPALGRQEGLGPLPLRASQARGRQSLTADHPGQDAPDVGVQRQCAAPVGEGENRPGGVVPDARQLMTSETRTA